MALDQDPRTDLRYLDRELARPMTSASRAFLEGRREVTARAVAMLDERFACNPCECGGIGCPECGVEPFDQRLALPCPRCGDTPDLCLCDEGDEAA